MSSTAICRAIWAPAAISPASAGTGACAEAKATGEADQRAAIEPDQPGLGVVAEQACGRAHADDGVVFLVLVRIDRVVADHPQDRAEIEHDRRAIEIAELHRPSHQRAPGKGEAEHELRPVGEPLHERIDGDDGQRRDAEQNGEAATTAPVSGPPRPGHRSRCIGRSGLLLRQERRRAGGQHSRAAGQQHGQAYNSADNASRVDHVETSTPSRCRIKIAAVADVLISKPRAAALGTSLRHRALSKEGQYGIVRRPEPFAYRRPGTPRT